MGAGFCLLYQEFHYFEVRYIKVRLYVLNYFSFRIFFSSLLFDLLESHMTHMVAELGAITVFFAHISMNHLFGWYSIVIILFE